MRLVEPPMAGAKRRLLRYAGVAELVDARDLGSRDASCGGSSPSARTTLPILQPACVAGRWGGMQA